MKRSNTRTTRQLIAGLTALVLSLGGVSPALAADDPSSPEVESATEDAPELAEGSDLVEDSDGDERPDLAQDSAIVDEELEEYEFDMFEAGLTVLDVVVLRPLGTLSTLGGLLFFVGSAPLIAPTGRLETTWDIFVFNSYDYTFVRPIGEL